MAYFRFFLGSPQRFLATLVGFLVVSGIVVPGLADLLAARIMGIVQSLLGPAVTLLFVYWALRGIVGGLFRGK